MLAVRIIRRAPIPGETAKAHAPWMAVGCAVQRSVSTHTKKYTHGCTWYINHTWYQSQPRRGFRSTFLICSHTVLYLLKGLNSPHSRVPHGVFCYENARPTREISAIWADLFFITLFFVANFLRHPNTFQGLFTLRNNTIFWSPKDIMVWHTSKHNDCVIWRFPPLLWVEKCTIMPKKHEKCENSDSSAIWAWFWCAPSNLGLIKGLTTCSNVFSRAYKSQCYWYVAKMHNLRGVSSFNFAKLPHQRPRITDLMCAIGFWGLN